MIKAGLNMQSGLKLRQQTQEIPAAITDIGCERDINEDRYAVVDCPAGKAWLVCDGMGGSLGGELAAQLAIDVIRRELEAREYSSPLEALHTAIEQANRIIVLRRQNPAFSAMGTTVIAALFFEEQVVFGHVGDSRAYLVRDGVIQQLTVDHTYVQDLVDRGAISAEDALSHPQAHVLTRCLGAEPRLEVDTQVLWMWPSSPQEPNDKLLLCSDGLYSLVSDREIAQIVSESSPQEGCVKLVELAKDRGGYDNITLAIVPIAGQLHEMRAHKAAIAKGAPRAKKPIREKMAFGKRLILAVFAFLIGGIIATLGMLIRIQGLDQL